MKIIPVAVVAALALVPLHARAGERVGDAALGALSGAVVFGPVGLVAGAVVGFTAGPSISQSWRDNRNHPRTHNVRTQHRIAKRPARVAAKSRSTAAAPAAGVVTPVGAGTGGPPAQGLE